ncbi:MAG TPA: hypothetical protein VHA74_01440, partial [Candidatus Dojkabacteria bacterium]|nr:hypothetical protein [Candidatus Dojkabacteria bacterium]
MEDEQYKYELERARKIYSGFRPIKCQAIGSQQVTFNYDGFNHLMFKGNRREREKTEQITRFR